MANETKNSTSENNLFAAIAYLGIVIALVVYIAKKEDKFVRFHAIQALMFDLAFVVTFFVLWLVAVASIFTFVLAFIVIPLIMLFVGIVVCFKFYLMYKAYSGERYHIPVIGEQAEKHVA